jgi:hypothetical protein
MSVYVSNYKQDIFVSYAHVDNEPLPGAEKGWVTILINCLKILLGKKLGHPGVFSLWMDDKLLGNAALTSDTIRQLEDSAIIVVILSPAYLISDRCRSELSIFLATAGQHSERVFVVEHDVVEWPPELSDLLGYKFWVSDDTGRPHTLAMPKPNPDELEYYQRLDDLARQLAGKLKSLKEQAQTVSITTPALTSNSNMPETITIPATITTTSTPLTTIFLAKVTDDLEKYRTKVKWYLDEQGIQILPAKAYSFANIQQSLDQDLSDSQLFVQLLSENIGDGYSQFQYERARAANLPILQWREPTLELATIVEPAYRAFLEMSTVIATGLVEFQATILRQLKPKNNEKIIPEYFENDTLVFINAAPEDMALAHQIKDILESHGIGYSLPLDISTVTKPAEIRQHLEQNLLSCDAILVVYDNTSVVWVTEQLLYCRRMQRRRDYPLKAIAVYKTPSTDKLPLNMRLPNMQILECPFPHINTCLPRFLQSL